VDRVVTSHIGIIAQARVRSSRLPRKVLAPLGALPLVEHLARRMQLAKLPQGVVIATGDHPDNQAIVEVCKTAGIECYVGSEEDTLSRFIGAAKQYGWDSIVRVTADNPLTDPEGIDRGIETFLAQDLDYFDNICFGGYPHGLGYEIIRRDVLEFSHAQWKMTENLEHVTWGLRRHLLLFRNAFYEVTPDLHRPDLRLSLDFPEDLELIQRIYANFDYRGDVSAREIIRFLDTHPEIATLNAKYADHLMSPQDLAMWQLKLDASTRKAWEQFRTNSTAGHVPAYIDNLSQN